MHVTSRAYTSTELYSFNDKDASALASRPHVHLVQLSCTAGQKLPCFGCVGLGVCVFFFVVYPGRKTDWRARCIEHVIRELNVVDPAVSIDLHLLPQGVNILLGENFCIFHLSQYFDEIHLIYVSVLLAVENCKMADYVLLQKLWPIEVVFLKNVDKLWKVYKTVTISIMFVDNIADFLLGYIESETTQHEPEIVASYASRVFFVEESEDFLDLIESLVLNSELLFCL
mmetsp:Transcript_4152/g.8276  ORF Transcript_4152/g.8276 Transcript_4152/m.8276 type:complete len:228 (-) Transcript_4152:108-791(-)